MEKFVLKIKDENIDLEDYLKSLPFVSSFKHTKGDIFSFDIEEDFHDEALDIFELMESDFYSIIKVFYYTSLFDETQINFLVSILDNKPGGIYRVGELLDYAIKNNINAKDIFKPFIRKSLSDELYNTAYVYIINGSSTIASELLYIHRNTLNYRLDVIKKITSLDLRLFVDKVVFYILTS